MTLKELEYGLALIRDIRNEVCNVNDRFGGHDQELDDLDIEIGFLEQQIEAAHHEAAASFVERNPEAR